MVTEDDVTLGAGHTIQYADHVSQKCTLETYIILLTHVTPLNLIFKKGKLAAGHQYECVCWERASEPGREPFSYLIELSGLPKCLLRAAEILRNRYISQFCLPHVSLNAHIKFAMFQDFIMFLAGVFTHKETFC